MEFWETIEGYEDYQVSNLGNVKKTEVELHKYNTYYGYLAVYLKVNGLRKSFFVHRLVAKAFIQNPMSKPQVNHINGIKTDNRVENLEWVTAKENIQHCFNFLGKQNLKGSKCNLSKLKESDVYFIRENKKIYSKEYLAKKFNTSISNVTNIINGKRWKHLL